MLRKVKSILDSQSSILARAILFCALSAVLLILSFPRFNLEFLAWVGFVPLFFALKNQSKGKAFLLSYLCGVIFWFGIIYWLIHVTLPGTILLSLYLALYFGIFGLIFSSTEYRALPAGRQVQSTEYLLLPAVWVLLEYIRSHFLTGFPWALLGYSQYLNLPIIQIADITGVWGVSFLVMMGNVAIYLALSSQSLAFNKIKKCVLALLCILTVLIYGYFKLNSVLSTQYSVPIKISVVQGNIPQELKWDPEAKDYIIEKYLKITRNLAKDKPDLIIWPEAALPVVLEEEPFFIKLVKKLAQEIKIPILLGAVTSEGEIYPTPASRGGVYYNSALLVSGENKTVTKYDKLHLVPFGEYIPLRKTFRFLESLVPIGDFTAGREYTLFKVQSIEYRAQSKFSVLICFEDLFPELSRSFRKKGADFLVNITNDAWFQKTSSPYQHLQASVFRAVENRIHLLRAANTGVSGFISPSGEIISLVQDKSGRNIYIDGWATQDINISDRGISFYTRYGDVFVVFCLFFVLFGINAKKLMTNCKAQIQNNYRVQN